MKKILPAIVAVLSLCACGPDGSTNELALSEGEVHEQATCGSSITLNVQPSACASSTRMSQYATAICGVTGSSPGFRSTTNPCPGGWLTLNVTCCGGSATLQ